MRRDSQDFVMPEADHADRVRHAAGGAQFAPGMAPYPLYGVPPGMGQTEPDVVWYRHPKFVLPVGIALGFALGYGVFGYLMPRLKPVKKNRKKSAADEDSEE